MSRGSRARFRSSRSALRRRRDAFTLPDTVTDSQNRGHFVAQALGHEFKDPTLLTDALTHSSFAHEHADQASTDNDRLEFLGDAVLEWAVSRLLWDRFPEAAAGELTRRRADLVCEEALADVARSVGVGEGLRLGRGEERSGGRHKPRLLASALEACMAAVYLDGGTEAAMRVCRALFEERMGEEAPGARDFKTRVQELLQSTGKRPPRYEVIGLEGPDHDRSFKVALTVDGEPRAQGEGRSKLEAEQVAAQAFLSELEELEE